MLPEPWAVIIEDLDGHTIESVLVYGSWLCAYEHVPDWVIDWLKGHGFKVSFKPVKLK